MQYCVCVCVCVCVCRCGCNHHGDGCDSSTGECVCRNNTKSAVNSSKDNQASLPPLTAACYGGESGRESQGGRSLGESITD